MATASPSGVLRRVKTTKVAGRRKLHFENFGDVIEDAVLLIKQGEPRTLGNWSAGRIFMHLARSCHFSIDGPEAKLAWWKQMVGKFFKNRVLRGPMPAGVKLPHGMARKLIPDDTSTELGFQALRDAIARLEKTTTRVSRHPFLGPMSQKDWEQFHLRHAELHMSFLLPAKKP